MIYDLQKAMIWKRISAWLFDTILITILAVGIGFCISSLTHYESYSELLNQRYEAAEQEFGVSLSVTEQEYENMLPDRQEAFRKASEAISQDAEAQKAYAMMMNLSLVITSLSLLFSCLLLEFMVPLYFGNGQTLGKKIFSIGVMSTNGIRVRTLQMFIRTVLGKFTIETMIPVLVGTLSFFGSLGIYGTMLIFGLAVLQIILLAATRTNALIHDLLAGTVVIDMPSQMIFENEKELLAYTNRVKAEMEARQDY